MPAVARILDGQAAASAIERYRLHHARTWHRLQPVLEATLGAPITQMPKLTFTIEPRPGTDHPAM